LPTPGPPAITRTFDRNASRTASRWLSARVTPALVSTHGMAFSASIACHGTRREYSQAFSDGTLGPMQSGEKDAGSLVDGIGDDLTVLQLQLQRALDDRSWHLEQRSGHRYQLLARQSAVPSSIASFSA
jgi:hypothetical protein